MINIFNMTKVALYSNITQWLFTLYTLFCMKGTRNISTSGCTLMWYLKRPQNIVRSIQLYIYIISINNQTECTTSAAQNPGYIKSWLEYMTAIYNSLLTPSLLSKLALLSWRVLSRDPAYDTRDVLLVHTIGSGREKRIDNTCTEHI